MDNLDSIRELFEQNISNAKNQLEIDEIRINFLGRKGKITELLKNMSSIESIEEKKEFGKKYSY